MHGAVKAAVLVRRVARISEVESFVIFICVGYRGLSYGS